VIWEIVYIGPLVSPGVARNADTHIRVSEETWTRLNRRKGPGDSFDDVLRELLDEEQEAAREASPE
jgi:hypothetical protein